MITKINNKEFLDSLSKESIIKVYNLRTNPKAPDYFSPSQTAFFNMNLNVMDLVLGNPSLPQGAFINFFGRELGLLIFDIYKKGPEVMAPIAELKKTMTTVPFEGATDSEIELYDIPSNVLKDYLQGKMTDKAIDYYKSQLEKAEYL